MAWILDQSPLLGLWGQLQLHQMIPQGFYWGLSIRKIKKIQVNIFFIEIYEPLLVSLPVKINYLEKMSSGQMDASMKTGA